MATVERHRRPRWTRKWASIHTTVVLVFVFGCCVGIALVLELQTTSVSSSCPDELDFLMNYPSRDTRTNETVVATTARHIVQRSFEKTYGVLQSNCPVKMPLQACMTNLYGNNSGRNDFPWWFQTLLRDTLDGDNGMFAPWHVLRSRNPPLQMCAMGKVGTTQWRKVFCELDAASNPTIAGCRGVNSTSYPVNNSTTTTTPRRFLFVRDPLERFLSAFLDKCVRKYKSEPHCEPSFVFQNKDNRLLMKDLVKDSKRFFEAYVDTMPLRWNMHFIPMGLFCNGIYRHIGKWYDYVGIMGPDFYHHVQTVGERYGIMPQVSRVFELEKQSNDTNVGVETKAATRVQEYYTAKTVRRVLEYVSIDYVALNMPIPEWAIQMIEQDKE